ncbi:MAG: hypothetical protein H6730_14980 [Deltaproteobacteria bacterium]|nr:hypothetical protein [Deltaproteobacteria bacterium]
MEHLREQGLFAPLKGVESLVGRRCGPINITLIRENIEDTYGAVEHMQTQDVAQCRRFITRPGSLQVHRYAFEAAPPGAPSASRVWPQGEHHEADRRLFLETFYEVAAEYPQLVADDLIVDDMAMRLVMAPELRCGGAGEPAGDIPWLCAGQSGVWATPHRPIGGPRRSSSRRCTGPRPSWSGSREPVRDLSA